MLRILMLCYAGTAVDQLTELRKALIAQHQQMFSPPLPDVEVYTSEKLASSCDQCQPEINHGMQLLVRHAKVQNV